MAKSTIKSLKNDVIYCVYVRNYGENGKFKDVESDLERIKNLGVDIIWLMPINEIGDKNKKGELGCPYAIKNYRKINPEYGTLDDFKELLDRIHELGMKCIIDVVFNHTSPDSNLVEEHPEFFYKNAVGEFANKIGDWSDVIDLDYSNMNLWTSQIATLKYWASLGVDGFRCDVAPLIPIDFWIRARKEVSYINENLIWLAESVHPSFIKELRKNGLVAHSDSEIYQAFDITYDYDVNLEFRNYLEGKGTLKDYINKLQQQEVIYPENYVKLRFLENHDQPRAKKIIPNLDKLKLWTEFMYFQKGTSLIYNGQEALEENTPSLFEIDKINFNNINEEMVSLFKKLYEIKKNNLVTDGFYNIELIDNTEVVVISYTLNNKKLLGVFNFGNQDNEILLNIEDGEYTNLLDESKVEVINGAIRIGNSAKIIEI